MTKRATSMLEFDAPEIINYIMSVSYTHLDVYKRQVFYYTGQCEKTRLLVDEKAGVRSK